MGDRAGATVLAINEVAEEEFGTPDTPDMPYISCGSKDEIFDRSEDMADIPESPGKLDRNDAAAGVGLPDTLPAIPDSGAKMDRGDVTPPGLSRADRFRGGTKASQLISIIFRCSPRGDHIMLNHYFLVQIK